jgi:diaminohydroxyphosphoribosylaminopyrimidine deaminase/5-amino-6-(5-phosphoribosylamino)uracil reductase
VGLSLHASDLLLLKAATELAEQGRFTCAPNPTVGCIIVRQGELIGRGYHAVRGEGHAEVQAIKDAGGDVSGATVYVSLEPCAFEGRTPACAQTLIEAKVARVVIALTDPHPRVAGLGAKMLVEAGIEVEQVELPEAQAAIRGYASRIVRQRPWVTVKTASSLDGSVALANGESQWITGPQARADVQRLRARSDAIVTGVGTVIEDNPRLTVRLDSNEDCMQPLRVVLDSHGRTPPGATLMTDEFATLIVHEPSAPFNQSGRAVTELAISPSNITAVLTHLADQGCNEVLVEAGPKVVGSFAKAALWDEWIAYIAPKFLGSDSLHVADFKLEALANAQAAKLIDVTPIGDDLRLTMVPQYV